MNVGLGINVAAKNAVVLDTFLIDRISQFFSSKLASHKIVRSVLLGVVYRVASSVLAARGWSRDDTAHHRVTTIIKLKRFARDQTRYLSLRRLAHDHHCQYFSGINEHLLLKQNIAKLLQLISLLRESNDCEHF